MKYSNHEKEFKAWFDTLGLKHFSAKELIVLHRRRRGKVQNQLPPMHMWRNMVQVLVIVDLLRASLGRSCSIVSLYRSPAYNKAVGGAPASKHKQGIAADIQFSGISPKRVHAKLSAWRNSGVFKGGLGLYSTFVHVDTRGSNASW